MKLFLKNRIILKNRKSQNPRLQKRINQGNCSLTLKEEASIAMNSNNIAHNSLSVIMRDTYIKTDKNTTGLQMQDESISNPQMTPLGKYIQGVTIQVSLTTLKFFRRPLLRRPCQYKWKMIEKMGSVETLVLVLVTECLNFFIQCVKT